MTSSSNYFFVFKIMFCSEICLVRISCDDPKGRVSLISFWPPIKFGVLY